MILTRQRRRAILASLVLLIVLPVGVWTLTKIFSAEIRDPRWPDPGVAGVTYWNPKKSYDGMNLVVPYNRRMSLGCDVMDMAGEVQMHLSGDFCRFSPGGVAMGGRLDAKNGSFLHWLDRDFNTLWHLERDPLHHDIEIDGVRREIFFPVQEEERTYLPYLLGHGGCVTPDENVFQGVRGYSFSGEKIFQWRTVDHLEELMKINSEIEFDCHNRFASVSKVNGVFVIDRKLRADDDKIFIPGNLLVSLDLCSCLIVLDRRTGDILWSYKPGPHYNLHIHHVTLTRAGEVMFFQNNFNNFSETSQDPDFRFSEVVMIDPYSKKRTWSYKAKRNAALFASWGGSAQELPNGNILITHRGAAFEITRRKEIVWEWINPLRTPDGEPDDVYRVTRMPHTTWDIYK